ncbi:DegV family protein [Neobacillus sp. SM06]|uniref:DegV family protein n=1 Tax=Neobacillus sp. SM06 TaxID=3422492 RepID=UPI003D2E4B80
MKTAIVTDSTAYIPKELRDQWNIHMIPLQVIFGDEVLREEVDIDSKGFFEKVRQQKELPKTSQPPVGEFVALFEKLAADGYDAVMSIHLSSEISGTFQGAVTAGTLVDGISVYPFDSEISCMVQGFYALDAAKMAERGVEPEEILARLEELKVTADAYLMVDDLAHLQRGGRLSSAQVFFGSLLQVKPLLHFANKVIPFEKIRTRKKAMKRIGELLGEAVGAVDSKYRAVIIHANREAEALEWKKELESQFPTVEFSLGYFGAVIGTHLGEGAMGMGWMKK